MEAAADELSRQLRSWLRREPVDADVVSEREHEADQLKRQVRIQLNRALWLPVPRSFLLQFLWHQDEIADLCQDAALLMSLRRPEFGIELEDSFRALGEAVVRAVHAHHLAVQEFTAIFENSASATLRENMGNAVDRINQLEHESDLRERELVTAIYKGEELGDFNRYHLIQLVLMLGGVVDQVENAAGNIRVMVSER